MAKSGGSRYGVTMESGRERSSYCPHCDAVTLQIRPDYGHSWQCTACGLNVWENGHAQAMRKLARYTPAYFDAKAREAAK